jgi:hypothetical protein
MWYVLLGLWATLVTAVCLVVGYDYYKVYGPRGVEVRIEVVPTPSSLRWSEI